MWTLVDSALLNAFPHILVHFNHKYHWSHLQWWIHMIKITIVTKVIKSLLMEDKWLIDWKLEEAQWSNNFCLGISTPTKLSWCQKITSSCFWTTMIWGSMTPCKFSTVEEKNNINACVVLLVLVLCTGWTACTYHICCNAQNTVKMLNVQLQSGSSDCGLFA